MDPISATGFASTADAYAAARPGWPLEAVDTAFAHWDVDPKRARTVDLAAGTGRLAEQLAKRAPDLVAIEPVDEMRAHITATKDTRSGTAEHMPLKDGEAQAVFVTEAFHWFDYPPTRTALLDEADAVLRRHGVEEYVQHWRCDLYLTSSPRYNRRIAGASTLPFGAMRRAIATATTLLALATAAPAAAQEPLPPQGPSPQGANDPACKPSAAKPYPVVLVHGTFANMWASWQYLSPELKRQGYCVWALDYGNNATGDIKKSARQLSTFVDQVLTTTGASKVSIVGHSQGGMMPRYYVKFLGGSAKVDDLIGLAPSNHGTTRPLAAQAGFFGCTACVQQAAGSPFLTELNAGDETPAPTTYTVVATRYDQVVMPYTSQALPANSRVTNVVLQDKCRTDPVEHVGIIYDPNAVAWVKNALGRSGPADSAFRPPAPFCF